MRKLGEARKFLSLLQTVWLFSALLLMGAILVADKPTKRAKKVKATVVHLLLDMTGSMAGRKAETIAAFNEYIKSLQASDDIKGFSFTFSQFNSAMGVKKVVEQVPMSDVPLLDNSNYRPDAITPLYDAIGRTIHDADKQAKKNDAVLIVIQTDGLENASQEYTKEAVKQLIKDRAHWQFVYLGCDLDAMGQGAALGIPEGNTMSYDNRNTGRAFKRMAGATLAYAATGSMATRSFVGQDTVDLRDHFPPSTPPAVTITDSGSSGGPSTWADA